MDDETSPPSTAHGARTALWQRWRSAGIGTRAFWASLRGRLLLLTIAFVFLAEILVFLPSSAAFRSGWLMERVERAQTASLALEASPNFMVSEELTRELLNNAGVHHVALKRDGARELILAGAMTPEPPVEIDMRRMGLVVSIAQTLRAFTAPSGRYLRLMDEPRLEGGELIEVIVPEAPLKEELWHYSQRIFFLSLFISAITGGLVYFALASLFVRPMGRLVGAMEHFRADPADARRVIQPSGRRDEMGLAEDELQSLQEQVRQALAQRQRLAALGEAVAKINHDLRNIFAAAQLVSDRLAMNPDPKVADQARRLVRSIDRGIALAEEVLAFGRAEERPPQLACLVLAASLADAFEDAVAAADTPTGLDLQVDEAVVVEGDPDHLHRIFVNLMRNAVQAMASQQDRASPGMMTLSAHQEGMQVFVKVTDTGPGVPERAQARLFQAFGGSTRKGGTGLGLSIARELAQAMGGDVALTASDETGATFTVTLPAARPFLEPGS